MLISRKRQKQWRDEVTRGQREMAQRDGTAWRVTRAHRGQGLVEFALILPIFLLLLFGVIEFALINASIGAFNFATQEAARFGAITGPTDPNSDTAMLTQVIIPRVNTIVAAQLQTIEVFKANEDGSCYGGPATFPCSTEDSYSAQSQQWTYGWPTSVRNDQLVVGDYLGVRVTYTYTYITAFFATMSPAVALSAESIQRIEPQEYTRKRMPQPVASRSQPAPASPALAALARVLSAIAQPQSTGGVRYRTAGSLYVDTSA